MTIHTEGRVYRDRTKNLTEDARRRLQPRICGGDIERTVALRMPLLRLGTPRQSQSVNRAEVQRMCYRRRRTGTVACTGFLS